MDPEQRVDKTKELGRDVNGAEYLIGVGATRSVHKAAICGPFYVSGLISQSEGS